MATNRANRRRLTVRAHRRKLRHYPDWIEARPHKRLARVRNRKTLGERDWQLAGLAARLARRDVEINEEAYEAGVTRHVVPTTYNGRWVLERG